MEKLFRATVDIVFLAEDMTKALSELSAHLDRLVPDGDKKTVLTVHQVKIIPNIESKSEQAKLRKK